MENLLKINKDDIGKRVMALEELPPSVPEGAIGIIRLVNGSHIGIDWQMDVDGHDLGNGACDYGRGWWYEKSQIGLKILHDLDGNLDSTSEDMSAFFDELRRAV